MNNKRTFRLNLDLRDIDKKPEVYGKVKQLDGTRIVANLSNFGEPLDLSDCAARLFAIKPDKTEVYQKQYISIEESSIIIECVDEIFELVGDVKLEIEIADMDGYIETFPTFIISVIDKINDDTQREIIRVEEISLMEELKDYIVESSQKIDAFKEAIDEMSDPDYQSLLDGLISTKQTVESLGPEIDKSEKKLVDALKAVEDANLEFNSSEEERTLNELSRVVNEDSRVAQELTRDAQESGRQEGERIRVSKEEIRQSSENLRNNQEESRKAQESLRNSAEGARSTAELFRVEAEQKRAEKEVSREQRMLEMKEEINDIDKKVDDIPNHGDFNVDVVVKGNVYATLDGVKPEHSGPPTKNAGNVLMPYARAVGGFTKDGQEVRTIGFISKPGDADPSVDITDDQNIDSVFIGTNVSQLFLYSKEKYPTIVSSGEMSPIATQDWVMRLVDGLGLLNNGSDIEERVTSTKPTEIFDLDETNAFSSGIIGKWVLDDLNASATYSNGNTNKYNSLVGFANFNQVTFSCSSETAQNLFVGLWRTENYIYGARINNKTLSVSYFDRSGSRGGAYNLTIRSEMKAGEKVTVNYNNTNQIWEFYQYDENSEPVLIYQLSKFMMSGFPEFDNGKSVRRNFTLISKDSSQVHFYEAPNGVMLGEYSEVLGYSF